MKRGYLSEYFDSVAAKRLSAVEVSPAKSNQHEFNGTKELKLVFGEGDGDKVTFPAVFLWLGNENEAISDQGFVTWYDARKNHPTRSEYRLYFATTEPTKLAREGDLLLIAKRTDGTIMIVITVNGSTIENQLLWLFGLDHPQAQLFEFSSIGKSTDHEVDFVVRFIFDELGIETEEPDSSRLDELLQRFYGVLPSTSVFSSFARETLKDVNPFDDPDRALMAFMDQEEKLFRRMERHLVAKRIETGFASEAGIDVDGFIGFSLQVQNRRKSRAGFALENHLEAILKSHSIQFSRGAVTENKSKPDFIFPSALAYHDASFDPDRLTMLAAKTSCKDRWRQITTEAARIKSKHLLTLEPSISVNQTNEMQASNVQLVIPASIHPSYLDIQKAWLLTVADFLEIVK